MVKRKSRWEKRRDRGETMGGGMIFPWGVNQPGLSVKDSLFEAGYLPGKIRLLNWNSIEPHIDWGATRSLVVSEHSEILKEIENW